jgi:hypothetical protein
VYQIPAHRLSTPLLLSADVIHSRFEHFGAASTNGCRAHLSRNATLPVVPICRTSLALRCRANHNDDFARLAPIRGAARDRHGRWVWDAVDVHRRAQFFARRAACVRTAKSCGSGAPMQALSERNDPLMTGANKPVPGKSTKETVKTIAQGMPVDAVYPWLLTPVLFCCTGGHGCNAHPAFPAPSVEEGGTTRIKPRAKHAARS